MATLPTDLRNKLERTCIAARNFAGQAAKDSLKALAVHQDRSYDHMSGEQRKLREKLRARAKQLGDERDEKGNSKINHLAQECAYEHWHRMLFARFLAENSLLIEPETGVAVSLDEVKELAKEIKEYRERMIQSIGMRCLFPVWMQDTSEFIRRFMRLGFKAVVTCVDPKALDASFVGAMIDDDFLSRLPAGVDPCGENGEFHSFVFDGPNFTEAVKIRIGEIVFRDGFTFCDLLPA